MAVGLDEIDALLRPALGSELMSQCPELSFDISSLLRRYRHSDATLLQLLNGLDALIFQTVFKATKENMRLVLDDGRKIRITQEQIRELADRLLALRYCRLPADSALRDDLLELSMENSYAAMRELLRRFPMEEEDQDFMTRVLQENGEEK